VRHKCPNPSVIKHRRSDIVVVDRDKNRAFLIDIAVPSDTGVGEKEQEKVDKYQYPTTQIKRLKPSSLALWEQYQRVWRRTWEHRE